MKRQRGRGRKPGGGGGHHHNNNNYNNHNPNRAMESNGPEVKVRGNASVIYERYLQLARDAASSGDRVLSENYLQHADHYFRMVRAMQPAMPAPQLGERFNAEPDYEGDEEGGSDGEGAEGEVSAEGGGDQPDADFPQGEQNRQFDRGGDSDFRRGRNRGRRNRFRPEGGAEAGEPREARDEGERASEPRADGEQRAERTPERAERQDRPPRRDRQPREREPDQGPEGFSSGPKPAFLRTD